MKKIAGWIGAQLHRAANPKIPTTGGDDPPGRRTLTPEEAADLIRRIRALTIQRSKYNLITLEDEP